MAESQSQELTTLLRHLSERDFKDVRFIRNCVYEILTLSTSGCDVSPALPAVIKLLAHPDAFIKRVAGEIVSAYAENNTEMALLATNTLVQDCRDINPVVRGLGLKNLASVQSQTSVENLTSAIIAGMGDSSAYVRKNAALAAIGLHSMSPTSVTETEIWDLLYRSLSDKDPLTVAGCLCAIEEIFSSEKGIVVSNKLGHYLISALPSFPSTVKRLVLQFLLKYSPKSKEKIFEHLNDLDDSLTKSDSLALTLCSLEAFCHLTSTLPKVKVKVFPTAWTTIKNNLARERNEELVAAAVHYLNLTDFPMTVCQHDFKKFFCRDDDKHFLMNKKITLLSKMIGPQNAELILGEFLSCSRRVHKETVQEMTRNVAKTIGDKQDVEKPCVDFFIKLMELESADIFDCVLQVLPWVTLSDVSLWQDLMSCVCQNFHLVDSLPGKISCLELLRSHGTLVKDKSLEILRDLTKEVVENHTEPDTASKKGLTSDDPTLQCRLKLSLLGALVSLCVDMPGHVQPLLSSMLELCLSDPRVRDRARGMYRMLVVRVQEQVNKNMQMEQAP